MRCWLMVGLVVAAGGCGKARPVVAHGKPVSHWLQRLQDPDAAARKKAVKALGHVGAADPEAIPALARAVQDRDAGVRAEAVLALLNIGPPAREAIPALEAARRDRDARVRTYAAKALERIRGGG